MQSLALYLHILCLITTSKSRCWPTGCLSICLNGKTWYEFLELVRIFLFSIMKPEGLLLCLVESFSQMSQPSLHSPWTQMSHGENQLNLAQLKFLISHTSPTWLPSLAGFFFSKTIPSLYGKSSIFDVQAQSHKMSPRKKTAGHYGASPLLIFWDHSRAHL